MASEEKKAHQKYFQDGWLKDPNYKGWLMKDQDDNTKFHCKLCHKTLEISTSGQSALNDHADGKKHKKIIKMRENFFKHSGKSGNKSAQKTDVDEDPQVLVEDQDVVGDGQQTLEKCLSNSDVTKAEIIWTLNCVMSGFSARSNDDLDDVFPAMFPDSPTAKSFSMARTKSGYVLNYGLGPHFKQLLVNDINKSDIFVASFDESLNHSTQSSEMDIYIRYWDYAEKEVRVRYLGSSFMGHGTHQDILKHFMALLEDLDIKKLYHISMDGPSVNLKFYDVFKASCLEEMFHSLVDIGVCSLHAIHGAFKTGSEKAEWNLKSILKGSFQILHDTPARREDYTSVTGSKTFPLYFCPTRWVDNKKVADRLISLWENIKAISKFWEALPKKKRPTSKSYINVKEAIEDDLTVTKLTFFSYLASLVEPYLKKYQTDKPMIPYMFSDLKKVILNLLRIIIKPDVLDGKSGQQLKEIDLDMETNLLPLNNINLGFATENSLKKLETSDQITKSQAKSFREGAQVFVKAMLKKMYDRSPLGSLLLRSTSIFDPRNLIESSRSLVLKRFKTLLKLFMQLNILSPAQCDQATQEFNSFLDEELKRNSVAFSEFDPEKMRLDHFFFKVVMVGRYEVFSFILRLVFCMSHGQASVERGFSLNEGVNQTNIEPETIISKRIIKDYMLANNLSPNQVVIDRDMRKAFTKAHQKYVLHLEEEKKKKVATTAEVQAECITADIDVLKLKCKQVNDAIKMMNDEFVQCMKNAEEKNEMSFVIKGNRRKRESEGLWGELSVLEKQISDLQEKKRKLC